jgi:hypothetical protein
VRIERIGDRDYAFGLTWIAARDSAAEDIETHRNGVTDGVVFYTDLSGHRAIDESPTGATPEGRARVLRFRSRADVERVIGYTAEKTKLGKAVFSYAAGLASLGQDGLYIAALSDNQFWYCGVKNGVVVPDTDHIGPRDVIRGNVQTMSQGLGLPVFAGPGATIEGASPFDLAKALGGVRFKPLRPLVRERKPITPILMLVGAIIVVAVGYRVLFPPKPKLTPQQEQAMLRQSYVSAVQSKVGSLPMNGGWVMSAYNLARAKLPPFIAGWTLQGVNCVPLSCTALYATDGHHTFALSPMVDRFGKPAVQMMQNGQSLSVMLPLHTPLRSISEMSLQALPPSMVPFMDWVGAVPLSMNGGEIDGQLLSADLQQQLNGAAAGMPPLFFNEAAVKGTFFLDRIALGHILRRGVRGGFVPVTFAFSFGLGRVPATWRMTWERIHG